jgi:hypothetical protein
MISAYHRAKFSAIKIIGQKITGGVNSNLMNMTTVSQTIPNHQLCTSCVNKRNSIDESFSDMTLNVRTDRQQKNSSKEYSAKISEL